MEREMVEAAAMDFLSLEVDFDYEFDASRYFDFGREETPLETWQAEHWFETAGSYPASPFISKMALGEILFAESINTMPKVIDRDSSRDHSDRADSQNLCVLDERSKDFAVLNRVSHDPYKNEKRFVFGSSTRGSTLMKPTASHLAKQNHPRGVRYTQRSAHRLWKPLMDESMQHHEDPSENGVHAAKRQKLEGGSLRKLFGMKQQMDLLHKHPQMNNLATAGKLRLTIPREPELETARRARKIRVQRPDVVRLSQEKKTASSTFKAYPFNKKILDPPSMPLCRKSTRKLPELQTSERTTHYSVAFASSLAASNIMAGATSSQDVLLDNTCFKYQPYGASKFLCDNQKSCNGDGYLSKFTARPLDKKILLSKGEFSVFSSAKRETTKIMEFNLSTNKRSQQDVPIELFNKLSLKSDGHQSPTRQEKPVRHVHRFMKDSKENTTDTAQRLQKSFHAKQANVLKHGTKQLGYESRTSSYPRLEADYMRKCGIR